MAAKIKLEADGSNHIRLVIGLEDITLTAKEIAELAIALTKLSPENIIDLTSEVDVLRWDGRHWES